MHQRVLGLRDLPRLQVGVKVGVAEAVDRLLGVAHQEQQRLPVSVHGVEDGELQRIGVLELVDQRGRKALPQHLRERRAAGAGQP
ncbi:MAG: hypothetical protein ABI409_13375, partial [Ramlibacter sp.]